MYKAIVAGVVLAATVSLGCGDDMAGTYVGRANEEMRGAAGAHGRDLANQEVRIERAGESEMRVRVADCTLPAFLSGDKATATLSHAPCDVDVGPYRGAVELFGSVSRSGRELSVVVNGNTRLDEGPATYRYTFEGRRRD